LSIDLREKRFGIQYTYFQEGSVPAVPEYLVHPDALADLAGKMGLRVAHSMNFLRFEEETPFANRCLTQLRRAMGAQRPLDGEVRQIAALYRAVVLQKRKRQREDS
jgi:hypothetical protein